MIKIQNLSIETLKGRKLVDNLSFVLNDGDRLAVIGEEGNGKSTLLKAIYDESLINDYCKVSGTIEKNNSIFGYFEQKLNSAWSEYSVMDYFLKETPESEIDYSVYEKMKKITSYMRMFGLPETLLEDDSKIGYLSGGEKVRLQLVKLNLKDPDVLLLDEPTNDLDIYMLECLEKFILNFKKPIIFISHDETLLENCANQILHIEQLVKKSKPKHTLDVCSYSDYVKTRSRSIEKQTQIAYSERREKEKKEEVLRQIKQKVENSLVASKKDPSNGRIVAKKMANIKAQEKKLEDEDLTEIPQVEEAIKLIVDPNITLPNQKRILEIEIPTLHVGDKLLATDIELKVFGPKKVAIIGRNGCGKTTLIKNILPVLEKTVGLKVGYFSQNYNENLDYNNSPVEELSEANSELNSRTLLGCLKFTREEMDHKIYDLSEGQKAKVLLTKLIIEKNNVLVLDEPTRNLSPLSNPVIRSVLKGYNGAIITVSHDRKFISEICDEIYELDDKGLHNIGDFGKKKDLELEFFNQNSKPIPDITRN